MEHLTGFASLSARYDAFIIDLWGVIHDGVTPYEGAIDALARLRAAGKPAILLSNAPRRSGVAQDGLRAMGVADRLYAGIVTSGEAAHLALRDRTAPWFARLGWRVYHLGPERDRNVIASLDYRLVTEPAMADWVLNTGPDDAQSHLGGAEFDGVLRACASAALPMLCANPDLEVIRGGMRVICAGALARRYAALGGDVCTLGKPDPAIYDPVVQMLGTPRQRILAIGDALRTDVAGAAAAGIAACWVLGGIHAEALGADPRLAEAAAQTAGLDPVATLPAFVW